MAPAGTETCPCCHGNGVHQIQAHAGGISPDDFEIDCLYCASTGQVSRADARRWRKRPGVICHY